MTFESISPVSQQQFGDRWTLYDQTPNDDQVLVCNFLDNDNKKCKLLKVGCIFKTTNIEIELYDQCPVVQAEE